MNAISPKLRIERIGSATLILGDNRACDLLTGHYALIADPPYGIGHVKGATGTGAGRNHRNTSAVYGDDQPFDPVPWLECAKVSLLWGADHYASRLPHGRWLAWNKLGVTKSFDSFSDVEFAWHSERGAARIFSHLWKGICQASGKDEGRVHPTQKPVALMEWCIEQARVPPGESIVDPWMGSGTTLIAAVRRGHPCVGCEIDPVHFEHALRRVEAAARQADLFVQPTARFVAVKPDDLFAEPTS